MISFAINFISYVSSLSSYFFQKKETEKPALSVLEAIKSGSAASSIVSNQSEKPFGLASYYTSHLDIEPGIEYDSFNQSIQENSANNTSVSKTKEWKWESVDKVIARIDAHRSKMLSLVDQAVQNVRSTLKPSLSASQLFEKKKKELKEFISKFNPNPVSQTEQKQKSPSVNLVDDTNLEIDEEDIPLSELDFDDNAISEREASASEQSSSESESEQEQEPVAQAKKPRRTADWEIMQNEILADDLRPRNRIDYKKFY